MGDVGLLEREDELGVLTGKIQAAERGLGGFVLVEGAAGVGKTRLLGGARAVAHKAGARVLAAQGSELERDFSYGVVRQLFEPRLATAGPTERDAWLSGAAEPARNVLGLVTSEAPAGDFATLHGLYWLAVNMSQDVPLVLMVDDLQWADAPSLRFVTYLVHRLEMLPIAVVAASRPRPREDDTPLLLMMSADPSTVLLRPRRLSRDAVTALVSTALGPDARADETFNGACYDATGGNPLLLHQLMRVISAEGIKPVSENKDRILELGPKAVSRYVALRLNEFSPDHERLAQSLAVFGNGVELQHAAAHADLSVTRAAQIADELARVHILAETAEPAAAPQEWALAFAHPLIRATIYASLGIDGQISAHARAAHILVDAAGDPQRVAAHLLHIPPGGDSTTVRALREAATDALARGSPDTALTYLHRCLEEPPLEDQVLDVLIQAGTSALMTHTDAAVEPLRKALAISVDPDQQTQLRLALGGALMYLLRPREAFEVYKTGLQETESEENRRWLAAATLSLVIIEPNRPDLFAYADEVAEWPPSDGLGGRALDAILAFIRTWQGDPTALAYAQRAISDDQLTNMPGGEALFVCVWWTLLTADRDEVFESLNQAIARAHQCGSIRGLAPAYDYRGMGWLWRGQISEAEADSRQAMRAIDAATITIGRPFNSYVRAEECMSQGRLDEARSALQWANEHDPTSDPGQWSLFLSSKARLLRLNHEYEQAFHAALQAGQRFEADGGFNPAVLPWRSEAALSLLALGRTEEARSFAEEEVALARRWRAPRALGRALRVAGLVEAERGLDLLTEAVAVLAGSPARLEYANALIDLGAELRRTGQRVRAKEQLAKGTELAHACGAVPLEQQGMAELKIAGARPRRLSHTGPQSLTPSEQRVAELAISGCTNRDIAQRLFITVKTVEVHLTSVYRKLGISRREEITEHVSPVELSSS
ncbi:helix-turn-helix transcriptional regulator [Streptomyces sp. NPDC002659]|uniref:helix-turn-helix transcriptional regulator n=1 Tax=Streptomyces sp. NPDC002659 TaxID=3364656 RepID=UPI0036AFB6F1